MEPLAKPVPLIITGSANMRRRPAPGGHVINHRQEKIMATVEGQQLNIEQMTTDRHDEQSIQLSNGLVFRCKYDLCSNMTTSTMHSPDGDVMSSRQAPEPGNFVREYVEQMEDLLNSHESIEDQRDKALTRADMASSALERFAEVS
jgi:hypothetical protein